MLQIFISILRQERAKHVLISLLLGLANFKLPVYPHTSISRTIIRFVKLLWRIIIVDAAQFILLIRLDLTLWLLLLIGLLLIGNVGFIESSVTKEQLRIPFYCVTSFLPLFLTNMILLEVFIRETKALLILHIFLSFRRWLVLAAFCLVGFLIDFCLWWLLQC